MTASIRLTVSAMIVASAACFAAVPASAAPLLDPGVAHSSDLSSAKPENVRWVCGPYRCWWRPGPPVGFYGPRPWGGPGWGYGRPGWGYGRPGWGYGRPGWGYGGWHGGWRRW